MKMLAIKPLILSEDKFISNSNIQVVYQTHAFGIGRAEQNPY